MLSINHEAGCSRPERQSCGRRRRGLCTPPAPPGGCTAPPPVDHLQRVKKRMITPKPFRAGPLDGLGDEGSLGGALIESYLYKGDAISPLISPSAEVSASAKTQESSVAARVREIAMAASRDIYR